MIAAVGLRVMCTTEAVQLAIYCGRRQRNRRQITIAIYTTQLDSAPSMNRYLIACHTLNHSAVACGRGLSLHSTTFPHRSEIGYVLNTGKHPQL